MNVAPLPSGSEEWNARPEVTPRGGAVNTLGASIHTWCP